MKKLAVLVKDGFETIEALTPVDVFRRADVTVSLVGMDSEFVVSSQNITIKVDKIFNEEIYDYDGIVIPGGMPGATNLQADKRVLDIVKDFYEKGKVVAAICAGPIVLASAGILNNKVVTCFPGFEDQLGNACYKDGLVQEDGNIITGKGPAAALEFSYKLVERFSDKTESIKEGMQYNYLMKK